MWPLDPRGYRLSPSRPAEIDGDEAEEQLECEQQAVEDDGELLRSRLELMEKERPDLVLADVMMPVLSGADLCRQTKASIDRRSLPVILMSSPGRRSAEEEAPTHSFRNRSIWTTSRRSYSTGSHHSRLAKRTRHMNDVIQFGPLTQAHELAHSRSRAGSDSGFLSNRAAKPADWMPITTASQGASVAVASTPSCGWQGHDRSPDN
jgi:CheY-like chemotaxis protein